jgi:hypothetical protein
MRNRWAVRNEEFNRKLGDHFRKQGDTYNDVTKINYPVDKAPNNGLMRVQIDGGNSQGMDKNGVIWRSGARNLTLEMNYGLIRRVTRSAKPFRFH